MISETDKQDKKLNLFRVIIFLVLTGLTVFMLPKEKVTEYSQYKEGLLAPEKIIAPFDYAIDKTDEELANDREISKNKIIPVFIYHDSVNVELYRKYKKFLIDFDEGIKIKKKLDNVTSDRADLIVKKDAYIENDSLGYELKKAELDSLFDERRKEMGRFSINFNNNYKFDFNELCSTCLVNNSIRSKVRRFLYKRAKTKILNVEKSEILNSHYGSVMVKYPKNDKEDKFKFNKLLDPKSAYEDNIDFLLTYYNEQENDTLRFWNNLIGTFSKPNLIYDKKTTDARIKKAQNDIPLAKGLVKKGEEIVLENMVITKEIREKLLSLDKELRRKNKAESKNEFFKTTFIKTLVGKIILSVIPYYILFLLLFFNRKTVFYNTKKMALLASIILLQLLVIYFTSLYMPGFSEYFVLIPIASMLLKIFFETRTAFFTTAVIAYAVSMIMGYSYSYFIIPFTAGVISIYSVNRIRDRFQLLYKSTSYIMLTYSAMAFGFYFVSSSADFDSLSTNIAQSLASAVISAFITFGLIALIEILFKMHTDITLLELSDMTQPLLKKLQIETPATYHHCIVVGNLAEAATEAVGGNSLLARVGAYYHDIGKTFKPEYFIENQKGENKHDKLPPNMSSLILINHVKEGVKLAREYKIPEIIVDFISTHHGTSRIEYFYHKAVEAAKETGEKVDDTIYKYPGPKPQTKETAIVMISDIVEARCRTIDHPSIDRFRQIIHEIIQKKFKEGELDDCDLKLNDLAKIREAMLPVIMGMYHSRIKYPDQKK